MNKCILIGRLVRDPDLKFTSGAGVAVATFTLAVDRNYPGADGKKETDFINIVCWRKIAENVANNLTKGRLVAVSGSIQTRKYQAQDGSNRYVTEIVADEVKFIDWPKDAASSSRCQENGYKPQDEGASGFFPVDGEDDDIPF